MAAFSATPLTSCFPCLFPFPHTLKRSRLQWVSIRAVQSAEPDKGKARTTKTQDSSSTSSNAQPSTSVPKQIPKKPVYSMKKGQIVRVDKEKYLNSVNSITDLPPALIAEIINCLDPKELYIVLGVSTVLNRLASENQVLKEVYRERWGLHLMSAPLGYLSVGHPPYYKGLDYIYEDRGEVLDLRIFETGEYALVAWVGIPTAPAWLPTEMLIKSEKLDYERL